MYWEFQQRNPPVSIFRNSLLLILFIGSLAIINRRRAKPKPFQCQTFEKVNGKPPHIISSILCNDTLKQQTIKKLINAVRIPTEMYDTFPDPKAEPDFEGWSPFKKLHEQLESDFPLVWEHLEVEKVNGYALLLTWKGTDLTLKPAVFAAHLDVVPVERSTWNDWEHDPFSGDFDGRSIWGRGSFDDKNMLIGMLQALEYMLENEADFKPTRTILVAMGSDEEASGRYGAKHLNDVLLERYGMDGIYSIIDEGVNGIKDIDNVLIASPCIGEKGYINIKFDIASAGGHSSLPPKHTTIGYAASIIRSIESRKFVPLFTRSNPMAEYYQCIAQYSDTMDPNLKWDFLHSMDNPKANKRVLENLITTGGREIDYLFRASQAIDMINGGTNSNTLPESTSFILNSRVNLESTVEKTIAKFKEQTYDMAMKFGLNLTLDEKQLLSLGDAVGDIKMTTLVTLEPAPVSPSNDVWQEFAGTIKGFYEDIVFPLKAISGRELIVAPSIMTANTDTSRYWNLTKNIYRYQPGFASNETLRTIHSVNEHVDVATVMHVVGFIYDYVHVIN